MQTILITAGSLGAIALAATVAVLAMLFFRVTAGAPGLRGRVQRLFRLPEKTHARSTKHYYHAYWGPR